MAKNRIEVRSRLARWWFGNCVLDELVLQQAQRGTIAVANISIPTRRQSTNVHEVVRSGGRNLVAALWSLGRQCRRAVATEQAQDGAHRLDTSDFRRGLFWTRIALAFLAALALAGTADTEAQGYRPTAPATATYFDFCVQGGKPAKCATSHRMDLSAIPTGQCITRAPASPAGIAGAEAGLAILPATVNPYPAGSVERGEWESARATCAAIARRWGRRTPFIGGPDVADGYFCPSNENLGQSIRALTEHFGQAPSELELIDFLHTCTTDQVGRAVASRFVSTGGGGSGAGCTVRHWTATPDWPMRECARWYPASTFTDRGCCGQRLADGRHRCVEHPDCWPVEPPPPPPVTCPDGTCSDAEQADGSCPADCPVEPPPPPPGECKPLELASHLAAVEAAVESLSRAVEALASAYKAWLTTPGEPSTGQTTSTLRSEQ